MKTTRQFAFAAATLLALCAAVPGDVEWQKDKTFQEYFGGWGGLILPVEPFEKVFLPDQKQANFTLFHGVKDVAVKDGKLTFTMDQDKATLGWGNYLGRQPVEQVVDLWEEWSIAVLRVRQTCDQSHWKAIYCVDGKTKHSFRPPIESRETEVNGQTWQELELSPMEVTAPTPDGLELTVEAPKGTTFEVEWVKIVQRRVEGYARKTFVIPPGKIWKAVADVGSANSRYWFSRYRVDSVLYMNGQRVKRNLPPGLYCSLPVDITPYLRTGTNCAAFYAYRLNYSPFVFIRATVIMESGEKITFRTDNANRIIEVCLSTRKPKVWSNSQSGVGAETGGKFFKTGRMQTLHWIHVADSGVHALDVINSADNWPAAARSLRIFHVRGNLPAVRTGSTRSYGIHTESCKPYGGFGMNFGVGQPRNRAEVEP